MVNKTIKSLAVEIHTSVDHLIQQFADAGINKTSEDIVTQHEKEALLAYLNHIDGTIIDNQIIKLTLQRKTRSTLNVPSSSGKSKSVNIEVRKMRTYIESFDNLKEEEEKEKQKQQQQVNKCELINKLGGGDKLKPSVKNNFSQRMSSKPKQNLAGSIKTQQCIVESVELEKEMKDNDNVEAKEEDARLIIKDNYNNFGNDDKQHHHYINKSYNEDNNKYYITSSHSHHHHAREAEDENDIPDEVRRIRNRGWKIIRQKKNNKLSEKINREEDRSFFSRINNTKTKGKQKKISSLQQSFKKPVTIANRDIIIIGETISITELANKMAVKVSEVIKTLMKMGAMVTINQIIDQETAQLVAEEMGHKVKVLIRRENELEASIISDRNRDIGKEIAEFRAPVVTIMGHVDHGKTSLIDYIRSTKVASEEAGGITQHIGAYYVETKKGIITFLDTPGHTAFTSMRARGAKITDIIILVVAADEGVMPQTIEAIQHAKVAKVPIIVAINKIDKKVVDLNRIKTELSQYGLLAEEWGGETQFINISAKKGIGIDELLEAILLQAEVLELKAVRTGMACGVVIESYLDKGRGPVATVLVQEGTLNKGDIILCGFEYGRVRAMRNQLVQDIQSVGPSIPVEILGLSNVPSAGDKFIVVHDEKKAREVALYRQIKSREVKLARQQKLKLENMFTNLKNGKICELNIVLKTDVQGSCEAITDSLQKLSLNGIKLNIISAGVGGISESDTTLAAAFNAIIIGFNVRADTTAKKIIENENLDIRYYSLIYSLIDDIKQAMGGMLSNKGKPKQQIIGLSKVRDVFKSTKFGAIAGCMVVEGIIKRNNPIRILRDNVVIYEGELESLRRFKDDVNEVRKGMECGIGVKNYNDIRVGDIIEVFEIIELNNSSYICN